MGMNNHIKRGKVPKTPGQVETKVKDAEGGYIDGIKKNRENRHQSQGEPPKPPKF